jgi:peptide/nickel transport system ATP-binding protein
MIFQDPMMTLNPVLRIDTQIIEAIRAHETIDLETARQRARDALGQVGIPSPDERLVSYPHQLSGGMRQRVAIAIAFLHRPALIIADEPTTALDVTIQSQILFEVQKLCRESGTALMWISHNLSVVAGLVDRVAVMYAGKIVEQGTIDDILDRPLHPYTHGLIGSIPKRNTRGQPLRQIPGMTPSLLDLAEGCAFRTRCRRADAMCEMSPAITRPSRGRELRCFHPETADPIDHAAYSPPPASVRPITSGTTSMVPIIEVKDVTRQFVKPLDLAERIANRLGAGRREVVVHAVDAVSFSVAESEVVGLVGESGCGKSTIGRIIAGILDPSAGQIAFRGHDVAALHGERYRRAKLKTQMIFQDPFASLNPRMRVEDLIGEAPRRHRLVPRNELKDYIDDIMERCGLEPGFKRRYPHQFSGGQRQRIGIARALAVMPEFLVCDESVASLDVSIQAQILNLFHKLREELNLTYLFISHDLGIVEHLSDRVIIMYLGRIVEIAPTEALFSHPNHPYTKALLTEIPSIDKRRSRFVPVAGEIPSPLDPPSGCHFHPRCVHAMARCKTDVPKLKGIAPGQLSACHLNDQL